jgi:hypothetical protein
MEDHHISLIVRFSLEKITPVYMIFDSRHFFQTISALGNRRTCHSVSLFLNKTLTTFGKAQDFESSP